MPTIDPKTVRKCYFRQKLVEQAQSHCEECNGVVIMNTHSVTIHDSATDEILEQYKEFTCASGHPNGQVGALIREQK